MVEPIITVENLSKRYRIGAKEQGYKTFREVITDGITAPIKNLKRLRKLTKFDDVETSHSNPNPVSSAGKPAEDDIIWALKDVSFEVKEGEILGIIGRNGAGKSTLLKVLSRITEPTAGDVKIYGRISSLLEVGTGFHPELTGRENIFLNGAILGMRKEEIKRKFDEIVAFAETERFIDTPVKYYSSGMYVRLAFAVAAHLEPEILLVDEVLAVGDAAFQKKCLGKMGNVAKEGRTVLFVSHNMTAIKSLCKRAILLDKGMVVEAAEAGAVVDIYLKRGTSSILEQVWDDPVTAPGNGKVQVHSARVLPEIQDVFESITVETPLRFEFEIWNHIPNAILNFTVSLFTIEGIHVLAAASDAKPRHRGLVKAIVRIPPNFLNDGIYTVKLQVVKDTTSVLYLHSDILVFEVHEATRTGNWLGKWPGVIRPRFKWLTEDVNGSGDSSG
jgi:lipopolysaccharide transport system ATP-binding protein